MPAWSRGIFGSKCFYSIRLANLLEKGTKPTHTTIHELYDFSWTRKLFRRRKRCVFFIDHLRPEAPTVDIYSGDQWRRDGSTSFVTI